MQKFRTLGKILLGENTHRERREREHHDMNSQNGHLCRDSGDDINKYTDPDRNAKNVPLLKKYYFCYNQSIFI